MIAYHFSKRFPLYKEYLSDALFFGGLAAIADVISMKSIASRALADRFLKEAGSKMKNLGFRLYMKACGLADGVMTTADVGFKLVPPLNAAGRLDDPNGVMALFDESVTTDGADRMIHKLQTLNLDRRREQDAICSDAHRAYEKGPALAYYSKNWHIGVVGPAAGRLAEALNIPVFLGGYSYNTKSFSFSGRSGGSGIDIHALLSKVLEGLPVQMGGHRAALGFRIKETDIESVFPVIQERLMALTPEVVPLRKCDVIVSTVSLNHWEEIRKLEPFGNGNPEPVVCVPKVSVELRKNPDRSDMSTGTAITCDGRRFECLIFHNPVLSSVTRFYGDIVGKLICDRRGSTPIVKLIIEDFIPPTPCPNTVNRYL